MSVPIIPRQCVDSDATTPFTPPSGPKEPKAGQSRFIGPLLRKSDAAMNRTRRNDFGNERERSFSGTRRDCCDYSPARKGLMRFHQNGQNFRRVRIVTRKG